MHDLIETIRAATAADATPEQKAAAATACRTLLTALETESGKPLAPPVAASPLAGIDPTLALDLLIARLTAALPTEPQATERSKEKAVRFAFVKPNLPAPKRR